MPNIKNEVDMFMKAYPKITVDVVNVGQGAPHYQKMRTAIQSGQGAPDVAQVEFQYIPSFTLGDGNLLDLTVRTRRCGVELPRVGLGPGQRHQRLLGRAPRHGPDGSALPRDLLSAAGIDPPKTWDDAASAAATYH